MSTQTSVLSREITGFLHGEYEDLASEYYDPLRHPTCANFREASDLLLGGWLREYSAAGAWICEVGAGRSTVAEQLAMRNISLNRLTLADSSAEMLAYSREWAARGALLVLADFVATQFCANGDRHRCDRQLCEEHKCRQAALTSIPRPRRGRKAHGRPSTHTPCHQVS